MCWSVQKVLENNGHRNLESQKFYNHLGLDDALEVQLLAGRTASKSAHNNNSRPPILLIFSQFLHPILSLMAIL